MNAVGVCDDANAGSGDRTARIAAPDRVRTTTSKPGRTRWTIGRIVSSKWMVASTFEEIVQSSDEKNARRPRPWRLREDGEPGTIGRQMDALRLGHFGHHPAFRFAHGHTQIRSPPNLLSELLINGSCLRASRKTLPAALRGRRLD